MPNTKTHITALDIGTWTYPSSRFRATRKAVSECSQWWQCVAQNRSRSRQISVKSCILYAEPHFGCGWPINKAPPTSIQLLSSSLELRIENTHSPNHLPNNACSQRLLIDQPQPNLGVKHTECS